MTKGGTHHLMPGEWPDLADRLVAVANLHQPRQLDGDGWTMRWCTECRQNYPCPTVQAVQLRDHPGAVRP